MEAMMPGCGKILLALAPVMAARSPG